MNKYKARDNIHFKFPSPIIQNCCFKMEDMDFLCPKPATGPLDAFRAKAGFDWQKLRVLVHGEELLRMKMRVWKELELEPIFSQHLATETLGL